MHAWSTLTHRAWPTRHGLPWRAPATAGSAASLTFRRWVRAWALWVVWGLAASAWAQVQLVTEEEAKRPDAKTALTRAITRGPGVKLASADSVKASGFALKVEFEARGGKRIDANSVKVEYLKDPVVDVTDRVKMGIRADAVEVSQALLPPGDHSFRVSVADVDGRRGSTVFSLKARP